MNTSILLQGCNVLTFNDNEPTFLNNQDILLKDNVISRISPSIPNQSPVSQVLDARGMLAVPGMINTHAHVPMVLFRNTGPDLNADDWFNKVIFPLEANLTADDVYWGAMLGIAEMIEAGITYVADHYFYMDSVAQAIDQSGMRANLVWAVFGHESFQKLEETLNFIKRWQGKAGGRITTWLGPHSPYLCDPQFLRRCAQEASYMQVGTHLHVSETRQQVSLSYNRYGKSPVKVLLDAGILDQPCIFGHCLYPTTDDLAIMADHPIGVAQATKTYLAMAMGLADLPEYNRRGIPVGLATDGAVSSSSLDLFEQMRLTALTQKHRHQDATVMNLDSILDMAFQGGARVLRNPQLGNLKEGFLADIVLLRIDRAACFPDINPAATLVYNLGAADVDTVICNGKILYLHGKHQTLDKKTIYSEIRKRLNRLLLKDLNKKVADYPS